jgi:hypothetical protein
MSKLQDALAALRAVQEETGGTGREFDEAVRRVEDILSAPSMGRNPEADR